MKIKDTFSQWIPFLEEEAELGNPDAMSILSKMHKHGFGAVQDDQLAQRYAEMEANTSPFEPSDDDRDLWAKPSIKV